MTSQFVADIDLDPPIDEPIDTNDLNEAETDESEQEEGDQQSDAGDSTEGVVNEEANDDNGNGDGSIDESIKEVLSHSHSRRSLLPLDCLLEFSLFHSLTESISSLAASYPSNEMPIRLQTQLLHLALLNNITDSNWLDNHNGIQFIDFLLSLGNYPLNIEFRKRIDYLTGSMKRQILMHSLMNMNGNNNDNNNNENNLYEEFNELWDELMVNNHDNNRISSLDEKLKLEMEKYRNINFYQLISNNNNNNQLLLSIREEIQQLYLIHPYDTFRIPCIRLLEELRQIWPKPKLHHWIKYIPINERKLRFQPKNTDKNNSNNESPLSSPVATKSIKSSVAAVVEKSTQSIHVDSQESKSTESSDATQPMTIVDSLKNSSHSSPSSSATAAVAVAAAVAKSPSPHHHQTPSVISSSISPSVSVPVVSTSSSSSSPVKRRASDLPTVQFRFVATCSFSQLNKEFPEVDWNSIGNQTIEEIQTFVKNKKIKHRK